jgi:hypothetical protein
MISIALDLITEKWPKQEIYWACRQEACGITMHTIEHIKPRKLCSTGNVKLARVLKCQHYKNSTTSCFTMFALDPFNLLPKQSGDGEAPFEPHSMPCYGY